MTATLGGYQPSIPDTYYQSYEQCYVAASLVNQSNKLNAYCTKTIQSN